MRWILIIILPFFLVISGCENKSYERLKIPFDYSNIVRANLCSDKFIVYYNSGDCSICFGILLEISDEFPSLNVVSIASSLNKVLLEYQLEEIKFKGISLIDSDSLFYKQNQSILNKGNLFLVDSSYNILVSSRVFDNVFKSNINKQLAK